MKPSIAIESGRINQALVDNILTKFLPEVAIIDDLDLIDDADGWYGDDDLGQTYTQLHSELTGLVLAYLGDLELNTTETYVFITYHF